MLLLPAASDARGGARDPVGPGERLAHLRVPDLVIRQAGPLHEPLTLLAMIAGVTARIELVPSVIVLPARPTALTAKQVSTLDLLSGGRVRLGVGLGKHEIEYRALGQDYKTDGGSFVWDMIVHGPIIAFEFQF